MPESIRTLLHDIGEDDPGPSRDLAAGALKRARGIGRRHFAAGSITAVCALAMAGAGAAGIVNARDADRVPPAGDPSTVVETGSPDDEEAGLETGCGVRPGDWEDDGYSFPDRGESAAAPVLDVLPETLLFRATDPAQDDRFTYAVTTRPGEEESSGLDLESDYRYYPAPDGVRALAVDRGDGCGAAYVELHDLAYEGPDEFAFATEQVISVEPVHCPIEWSPDSDKVMFTEPTGFEDPKSYVLDVATGELTELPEELFCGGVWLPDSEHLWNGATVMRPDGSDEDHLPGLDRDVEGAGEFWPMGMSADRGAVCIQDYDAEEGDIDPWQCEYYLDPKTGRPLELPVEGDAQQVVFLADGSMIELVEEGGVWTVYLVDPAGAVVDERTLTGLLEGELELLSYRTE